MNFIHVRDKIFCLFYFLVYTILMKPFYESSDYTNFSKILLSKHGISSIDNHTNQINNLKVNRPDSRKLQSIFRTYWFKLKPLILNRLRPAIISNVESMIKCHDLYEGYLFYECNTCDMYHITGISCHLKVLSVLQ